VKNLRCPAAISPTASWSFKAITSFNDKYFTDGVSEAIKHSWYNYSGGNDKSLHPYKGETTPNYTDFQDDGKYSWLKSPTFYGKPMQVGPLPCAQHAGRWSRADQEVRDRCTRPGLQVAGTKVGVDALHSTIGRHAARAVGCAVQVDELLNQWDLLLANMGKGDLKTFNKPVFPKGEQMGVGFHEAPRGVLSHWVVIDSGKIKNYQCVVPTTWNAAPRNEKISRVPTRPA
jgi:hydrogenase large subunit